jgi:hypothetical protein
VGAIEKPDKPLPSGTLIAAVDIALNAEERLVQLWKRAYDAHMKRREALKNMVASTAAIAIPPSPGAIDAWLEILERIVKEQVDYVDVRLVNELERLSTQVLFDYESLHSAVLAPFVNRLDYSISKLLLGNQTPSELERLRAAASRFSGALAEISSDLGEHDSARLYALESFTRAKRAKNHDLAAWSCGVQSQAAYAAGNYRDAVELARQPGKHSGPHVARLALNEAKALARMDDPQGANYAVERGIASSTDTVSSPFTSLTLDAYDLTLSERWACNVYATIGDANKVQEYSARPLRKLDDAVLAGGSILRIEIATGLIRSDPDQVNTLVTVAANQTMAHPVAAIRPEMVAFLAATRSPEVQTPAIRDAIDAAQTALRQLGQKRV